MQRIIFLLCACSSLTHVVFSENKIALKNDRQLIGQGVYKNSYLSTFEIANNDMFQFTGTSCAFRNDVQIISTKNEASMKMYSDYKAALKATGIIEEDSNISIPIPQLGFQIPILLKGGSDEEIEKFDGKYHAHLYLINYQSALFTVNKVTPDLNEVDKFYAQFKNNRDLFYKLCGEGYVNYLAGIKANIVELNFSFNNSYGKDFFQHKIGVLNVITDGDLLNYGNTLKETKETAEANGTLNITSYTVGNPKLSLSHEAKFKLKESDSIHCSLNEITQCGGTDLAATLKSFSENLNEYDYAYYVPKLGDKVANTKLVSNPIKDYTEEAYLEKAIRKNKLNLNFSLSPEQQKLKILITNKYKYYIAQLELSKTIKTELKTLLEDPPTTDMQNIYMAYYGYYSEFNAEADQLFSDWLSLCSPRLNYNQSVIDFKGCYQATTDFENALIKKQQVIYEKYITGYDKKFFLVDFIYEKNQNDLNKKPTIDSLVCSLSNELLSCGALNEYTQDTIKLPYQARSENILDNVGYSLENLKQVITEEWDDHLDHVTIAKRDLYLPLQVQGSQINFACRPKTIPLWKYLGEGWLIPYYYGAFDELDPRIGPCPKGIQNQEIGLRVQTNKLNPIDSVAFSNIQIKIISLPEVEPLAHPKVVFDSLLLTEVNGDLLFQKNISLMRKKIADLTFPLEKATVNLELAGYTLNINPYEVSIPLFLNNQLQLEERDFNLPEVSLLNNQTTVIQGCDHLSIAEVADLPMHYSARLHCKTGNKIVHLFVPDLNERIYLDWTSQGELMKVNLIFKP